MNLLNAKREKIAEITDEVESGELAKLLGFERVFIYEPIFMVETQIYANHGGDDELVGYVSTEKI